MKIAENCDFPSVERFGESGDFCGLFDENELIGLHENRVPAALNESEEEEQKKNRERFFQNAHDFLLHTIPQSSNSDAMAFSVPAAMCSRMRLVRSMK